MLEGYILHHGKISTADVPYGSGATDLGCPHHVRYYANSDKVRRNKSLLFDHFVGA